MYRVHKGSWVGRGGVRLELLMAHSADQADMAGMAAGLGLTPVCMIARVRRWKQCWGGGRVVWEWRGASVRLAVAWLHVFVSVQSIREHAPSLPLCSGA